MRRVLFCLLLTASALLWVPVPAEAQDSAITSPQSFSTVRGRVAIEGTAVHPSFLRYELYYSPEPPRDDTWVFIGEAGHQPVVNGVLGFWHTQSIPDGVYSLRMRVVRQDGQYDEHFVRSVEVANTAPTPTPTPDVSPTPEEPLEPLETPTPTVPPPTPTTVIVEQPEIIASTPTPDMTPILPGAGDTTTGPGAPQTSPTTGGSPNADLLGLGSLLSIALLSEAFMAGMRWSAAIFLSVGALFGVKRVLAWLWASFSS